MRGSLKLGSVSGIGIFVHWTFVILVAWVVFANLTAGLAASAIAIGFVLAVFACIVLHELGHALMAQHFGVGTRDITLLPIGGVARLERIPENPRQELLIAVAGPAVNVVIAGALLLGLAIGSRLPGSVAEFVRAMDPQFGQGPVSFLLRLLWVNVFLVLFNMLPAFPMDGGRVLRALLAFRMEHAQATRVASIVGQSFAVVFGLFGLFTGQLMLILLAVFVFLGAQGEGQIVKARAELAGVPVRDAMVTHFSMLSPTDTLAAASEMLLAGAQQDFPVSDGSRVVGVLPRAELIRALARDGPATPVGQAMQPACDPVHDAQPLSEVFERMKQTGCALVPVVRSGRLIGIVTPENVAELLMVQSALRRSHAVQVHPT